MPKRIELVQGSQEWLDYRRLRIGASDIPIILGLSPYKTAIELYYDKIGVSEQEEIQAMSYGKRMEPKILEGFNEDALFEFTPAVLESDENTWAICSLDGYNEEMRAFVEIKTANKKDHEIAMRKVVPGKYYPQVQWQYYVSNALIGYYCSWHKDNRIEFTVARDPSYIEMIMPNVKKFCACLALLTPPNEL